MMLSVNEIMEEEREALTFLFDATIAGLATHE